MVVRVPRTAFQSSKAILNLLFQIRFTGLRINIEHFSVSGMTVLRWKEQMGIGTEETQIKLKLVGITILFQLKLTLS